MHPRWFWRLLLPYSKVMTRNAGWIAPLAVALIAGIACGGETDKRGGRFNADDASVGDGDGTGGGGGGGSDGTGASGGTGAMSGGDAGVDLVVEPADLQTLVIDLSAALPTLEFTASLDGVAVAAGWNVDRGEIGSIEEASPGHAVFTPTGTTGGLVTVRAGLNGEVVERQVLVQLVAAQDGADTSSPAQQLQIPAGVAELTAAGGVGGVGGEGLGGALGDAALAGALSAPGKDGAAEGLRLLYPYDQTVWPRGMLAPLLMWESSLGSVDAIRIELTTSSGSFSWAGTFAPPAILAQTGSAFTRHPIPQDAWAMATDSAGGPTPDGSPDELLLSLSVAKGGVAYGPVTQHWKVAPARLSGTIYYNSYGTNLAKNYNGAVGGDGTFGGAVLSIRVGDTGPALAAGADGDSTQCRVCHSVSADGSRLFTVVGGNQNSASYSITPLGITEEILGEVEYPALSPDGRWALTPDARLLDLDSAGAATATVGLTAVATNLGTPIFSHDGSKVAFNPTASTSLTDPTLKLVVMDADIATATFTNPVTVVDNTGQPAANRPGWPAFTPDGALVFHQQTEVGLENHNGGDLRTRRGAKAHLSWTPTGAAMPTRLKRLNGRKANGDSYLPKLAAPVVMTCDADGDSVGHIDADHADDTNLNYEPTVNPVASGGYSWVVFTSRRLYGNVATIPPFCSDPRGVDLIQHITTKKLWVAAMDLNAAPGGDPSHPAFYLPAQELLAGNARGFWVLDPCRDDGSSCETGDQCCNGYCSPDGDGALVCANEPPEGACSKAQEHCDADGDCCDPDDACINHFCSIPGPQ